MVMASTAAEPLAQAFVKFCVEAGALKFGEFTTKAGRLSPYFFNAGLFDDGAKLGRLAEFYARALLDSGVQVLSLQQRLIELGWLTGKADGDFGSNTEKAVMAFQKQAGLNPTGKATVETQTLLFSAYAPYAPVPTQAPTQVLTAQKRILPNG